MYSVNSVQRDLLAFCEPFLRAYSDSIFSGFLLVRKVSKGTAVTPMATTRQSVRQKLTKPSLQRKQAITPTLGGIKAVSDDDATETWVRMYACMSPAVGLTKLKAANSTVLTHFYCIENSKPASGLINLCTS